MALRPRPSSTVTVTAYGVLLTDAVIVPEMTPIVESMLSPLGNYGGPTQTLLPRPPDTEFKYSNSGYVVLAKLVETVTRKRFASLLKKKLFTPFGMGDTYVFDELTNFSEDAPEVVNHARNYNLVSGQGFVPVGYTPMNFITGDGNVHSTIRDLAAWEKFLHTLDYNLPARKLLWSPVLIKKVEHAAKLPVLTSIGTAGVGRLGRLVPVVGGVVAGGFDAAMTQLVGRTADRVFTTPKASPGN
jgi:hypothetical protein